MIYSKKLTITTCILCGAPLYEGNTCLYCGSFYATKEIKEPIEVGILHEYHHGIYLSMPTTLDGYIETNKVNLTCIQEWGKKLEKVYRKMKKVNLHIPYGGFLTKLKGAFITLLQKTMSFRAWKFNSSVRYTTHSHEYEFNVHVDKIKMEELTENNNKMIIKEI